MAPRKTTTRKPASKAATETAKTSTTETGTTETGTTKTSTAKTAKSTTTTRKTVKIAPKASPATTKTTTKTTTMVEAQVKDKAQDAAAVMQDMEETLAPQLRKRGLIAAVTERAGVKRRDAKASIEAALEVLGEAIADGRGVNLPGFGKLKVVRTKKMSNAHIYVTRIRQPDGTTTDSDGPEPGEIKDPLAEAAE